MRAPTATWLDVRTAFMSAVLAVVPALDAYGGFVADAEAPGSPGGPSERDRECVLTPVRITPRPTMGLECVDVECELTITYRLGSQVDQQARFITDAAALFRLLPTLDIGVDSRVPVARVTEGVLFEYDPENDVTVLRLAVTLSYREA